MSLNIQIHFTLSTDYNISPTLKEKYSNFDGLVFKMKDEVFFTKSKVTSRFKICFPLARWKLIKKKIFLYFLFVKKWEKKIIFLISHSKYVEKKKIVSWTILETEITFNKIPTSKKHSRIMFFSMTFIYTIKVETVVGEMMMKFIIFPFTLLLSRLHFIPILFW